MKLRVTVYCGSSRRSREPYLDAARCFGAELAHQGHQLVYGGGRTGLMGAVADAALSAGGHVEGVILREFIDRDVHHRGLADLASVGDMRERKAGLAARADAFVALPGGLGTLEEVSEILSFRKLGLHDNPVVLLNTLGFFEPLVAQIERAIEDEFDDDEVRGYFALTEDPVDAVRLCRGAQS